MPQLPAPSDFRVPRRDLSAMKQIWPLRFLALGLAILPLFARAEALSPEVAAKVERVFARWDRPDTPGAIIAIARAGETVYARGFGMANLEHGIPMSPEILSETGSVAKQFTAAAVTLLAVRGRLSLDDSLQKHLPEMPDFARAITLRMMLDHTSGLRDIHGLFDLMGRPTYTNPHENAEVLEVMCRQRELNFPPGAEYVYCNTGYLLLTFVVERASGRPFAAFCDENIFRPRGMTHTAWRTQFNQIVPGRASAYAATPDGFRTDLPYSNIYGNGGLLTTVGDLLLWNESFETAEGEWRDVVRLMQVPSKLNNGQPIENGLGLRIAKYRGLDEVSHSGATAGYSTFLARFPNERLSIAVLGNCNILDAGALVHRIVDAILALPATKPAPRAEIALTAEELAAHAGMFHSAEHDLIVKTAVIDGKLVIGRAELLPIAPHTFVAPGFDTEFAFGEIRVGRPQRLSFTSNRITRSYTLVPAASPGVAQLADYVGDYYSPELDVTIPVTVKDGALAVRIRPAPAQPAEPTFADGFWIGRAWHVTFKRGGDGKVDGFEATNAIGRCRRIKFVRR